MSEVNAGDSATQATAHGTVPSWRESSCRRSLLHAVVIAGVGTAAGVAYNAFRGDSLPWVATEAYAILVPCPEKVADAEPVRPGDPIVRAKRTLLIDARTKEQHASWRMDGALFVEFDWLGPPIDDEVARIAQRVASSGAHRVVVYGDGDDPDSGWQWARLLAGANIKNVSYVVGGAPALREAQVQEVP